MGRRSLHKNYRWPGIYHITINVKERRVQPLGRVVGNLNKAEGDADAPRVELTETGRMVEQELLQSISKYYPMVEVQDYVVMPDHLHFIIKVHSTIISRQGKETHLGQVIAGFKKGCNRNYWQIKGIAAEEQQSIETKEPQGKPAAARSEEKATQAEEKATQAEDKAATKAEDKAATKAGNKATQAEEKAATKTEAHMRPAVYPQGFKVPSNGSTGRAPLFDYRYVDVMPIEEGQLELQRRYIRNNPRNRLLRMSKRDVLTIKREYIDTAVTPTALKGYLQRECGASSFTEEAWDSIKMRLHIKAKPCSPTNDSTPHATETIVCDSYGDARLLQRKMLPVVCHRKDAKLFATQKERCMDAAAKGAVLVGTRIAKGEREIMDAARGMGYAVIVILDNGLPDIYHPSEERQDQCAEGRLLIISPWIYAYRHKDEAISVAECKTMNCIVQAICRQKDDWWKDRQQ